MDRDVKAGITVMFCMIAGIVIAGLEYMLYEQQIIFHQLQASITEVMAITVLLWALIGMILAVTR